jgi:hypothetical protein
MILNSTTTMKTTTRGESPLSATPCSLFLIRGIINGAMCYVSKDADKYVAKPSTVGVHAATLFEHRQDAKNALDEMRHGTAVLMEIVELSPANAQALP